MDNGNLGAAMTESASQSRISCLEDDLVLIAWLHERISALERLPEGVSVTKPELPSAITGFGCIPLREEARQRAFKKLMGA